MWLPFSPFFDKVEDAGFQPGSAATMLPPVPRLEASELSADEFLHRHVLAGIPAIIKLSPNDTGLWPPESLLDKLLASNCSDQVVRLMSKQQADLVDNLQSESLPLWKAFVANLLSILVLGTTIGQWDKERTISLRKLALGVASTERLSLPFAAKLLQVVEPLVGSKLVTSISVMSNLISQPVYLADLRPSLVCPEILVPLGAHETSYEMHASKVLASNASLPWITLEPVTFAAFDHEPFPKVFLGGPKSYSYPLHRDVSDGDVLCIMYGGCKDLVVMQPSARMSLNRLRVPGFESISQFSWAFDFYSTASLHDVDGWHGTAQAGELYYIPGEMLHLIRNSCKQSLSVCRRPWRASRARDVFLESMQTVRLVSEFEDNAHRALRTFLHGHGRMR
eukprot:TRINITY_DN14310_c0_g3_i1.p1 TRINITY_DN14310_c0_g3~~TRINITY_DN14310_c0_g3_i1.p1  ORF type:complete len:432 (+),score=54.70 TRINITY_DN14310_c0_g3_i1:115-1296(+)